MAAPGMPTSQAYRSHTVGDVDARLVGHAVTLVGWVAAQRALGGIRFLVLRDAYGAVQVTLREGEVGAAAASGLRLESIVAVTGVVTARPPALINRGMASGAVEVVASRVTLIAAAPVDGLPVQIGVSGVLPALPGGAGAAAAADGEETRLTYRYLDLRRPILQRNLRLRSAVTHAMRDALHTMTPPFVEARIFVSPFAVIFTPCALRRHRVPHTLLRR